MKRETFEQLEIVSIAPSPPGWWVVYMDDKAGKEHYEPVAAWAAVRYIECDVTTCAPIPRQRVVYDVVGAAMCGVIDGPFGVDAEDGRLRYEYDPSRKYHGWPSDQVQADPPPPPPAPVNGQMDGSR